MKTFLILVCSIALACSAGAAQNENKSKKQAQKNKQAQSTQYARTAGGPKKATSKHYQTASTATSYQKTKGRQQANNQAYRSSAKIKTAKSQQRIAPQQPASRTTYYQKSKAHQQVNNQAYQSSAKLKTPKGQQRIATQKAQAARYATKKTKQGQQGVNRQVYQSGSNVKKPKKSSQQIAAQNVQAGRYATSATYNKKTQQWKGNKASAAAFQPNAKKYKVQHFNLASNTRSTKFTAVKFQQNRRIQGSQYWQGKNYWAFRNYRPVWHDRIWWRNHYNRVVFVYGGWYYWNAGWWYPAWGYDPGAYYVWDGPIYGYNGLPPDQVVANVQAALQEQGYYQGEVDGLLGPLTRQAIADYQRDNGLYMTSAIDRPTLESLGMT
jgi:Putative peptidoglycan binding domain